MTAPRGTDPGRLDGPDRSCPESHSDELADAGGRIRRALDEPLADEILIDRVRREAESTSDPELRAELVATWRKLRRAAGRDAATVRPFRAVGPRRRAGPVLSMAEACRELGWPTSRGYDLHNRGQFPIPVVIIGSRRKVLRADLDRYLATDPESRRRRARRSDGPTTCPACGRRLRADPAGGSTT
jgi:hypothetical protein